MRRVRKKKKNGQGCKNNGMRRVGKKNGHVCKNKGTKRIEKKNYDGKSCKNVTGMERVARKTEKIIN